MLVTRILILTEIRGMRSAVLAACSKRPLLCDRITDGAIILSKDKACLNKSDVVIADPGLVQPIVNEGLTAMTWLQSTYAGVNLLMSSELRKNFVVSRVGRGFAEQMAEYVLGWILALHLKIPETVKNQSRCEWNTEPYMTRGVLKNKTIGILGAGEIGRGVAKASKAFGLVPVGLVRSARESTDIDFHLVSTSVEEVLASSDIIVNCLPSTPHTRNLLTLSLLQTHCAQRSPLFINIGRGDVISSETILTALGMGLFRHCVLDVVEQEPLPAESPLWTHPSVSITPHISALSYPDLVADIFADNLERYLLWREQGSGGGGGPENKSSPPLDKALLYVADWEAGY